MFRRIAVVVVLAALSVLLFASVSAAALPPGGTFIDDDGDVHEGSIEAIYAAGLTGGCDSRGIRYCPNDRVTRGQMAAFLARALNLPVSPDDRFTDDNSSDFEAAINKVAAAGITLGCNPPANTRFCPDRPVTRAEMATFLVRSFPDLPDSGPDVFTDDNTDVHQANINRIAAGGITVGCNPPTNDHYCPGTRVTRGQMATFLTRALHLQADKPPAQFPIERVASFTTRFNCCEPRVTNIRAMARQIDDYVVMPGETFSVDRIAGPRTTGKGYVAAPYMQNGAGQCCAIGGGVSQFGTTMYNAIFWGGYEIIDHQPHSGWISRYPLGIEATLVYSSIDLKFKNDTVTPVYVRTSTTSTSLTVELWGYQGGWRIRGSHPSGSRSSSITILDRGGSDAKRVSARVTGSAPGAVRVIRTLTQGGVAHAQTWNWFYLS
ncbi:MAG TPA: VanW family protein [Acidimicrobiia bacterium]